MGSGLRGVGVRAQRGVVRTQKGGTRAQRGVVRTQMGGVKAQRGGVRFLERS